MFCVFAGLSDHSSLEDTSLHLASFHLIAERLPMLGWEPSYESLMSWVSLLYSKLKAHFSSKLCISSSCLVLFISNSIFFQWCLDENPCSKDAKFSAFILSLALDFIPIVFVFITIPHVLTDFFSTGCDWSAAVFSSVIWETELISLFGTIFCSWIYSTQSLFKFLRLFCCSARCESQSLRLSSSGCKRLSISLICWSLF